MSLPSLALLTFVASCCLAHLVVVYIFASVYIDILLGKTLMARQIGKMLNCKEPKIINGPEILNKYVGQSEEVYTYTLTFTLF